MYHSTSRPVDEEALAGHLEAPRRLERGAFFTPRPVVDRLLDAVTPCLPFGGPAVVVDPACGAGAFLVAAAERWPAARLVGAELEASSAALCRQRVPGATVLDADALASDALEAELGRPGFELWVGNPPYNGTSPLLRSKAAWARACGWLPEDLRPPPGTSLRDDYVFFLLRASSWLASRAGALAFVTSATLLDAYGHAPVRQALLRRLQLREVEALPDGAFQGTRVRTCLSVWTTARDGAAAREAGRAFTPRPPVWALRAEAPDAVALDEAWRRAGGVPLEDLVPVTFSGLKTRFDELLVDADAKRLEARVRAFLAAPADRLADFAEAFGVPARLLGRLEALKRTSTGLAFRPEAVRGFLHARGARPLGPPAWCYLERALIPRGDHRQRGVYDPFAHPVKLVFNRRELPLAARVLELPGCLTAYRHSRFAPLEVPVALLEVPGGRPTTLGPLAPNLTARGLEWAAHLGSPRAVFEHIAAHLMGEPFQAVWAPAFGRHRAPLVAPPDAWRATGAAGAPAPSSPPAAGPPGTP
jgi:N-6 DNA Methylase